MTNARNCRRILPRAWPPCVWVKTRPIRFWLVDANGEKLMVRDASENSVHSGSDWRLKDGKSKVLSTSDRAAALVVLAEGNRELFRIPVRLNPKTVTTLTQ